MLTQRVVRQVLVIALVLAVLCAVQTVRLLMSQQRVAQQENAIERYSRLATNLFHVPTNRPATRHWFNLPTPAPLCKFPLLFMSSLFELSLSVEIGVYMLCTWLRANLDRGCGSSLSPVCVCMCVHLV
jgi:hypothetical protein